MTSSPHPTLPVDPWCIRETAFDTASHFLHETLFALGNGYIGLRATGEEGYSGPAGTSLDGTYLNGSTERMAGPRRIEGGDLFLVGHYEVQATLTGEAAAAVERHDEQAAQVGQQQAGWGWDAHGGGEPPTPPPPTGGWNDVPVNSGLASGAGGASAPLSRRHGRKGNGGGTAGHASPAASAGAGVAGARPFVAPCLPDMGSGDGAGRMAALRRNDRFSGGSWWARQGLNL